MTDETVQKAAADRCWRCKRLIAPDGWCPCDDVRDDDYDE